MNDAPRPDDLTRDELLLRVLYALLQPAVRLASAFGIPLKELGRLLESGYYNDVRGRAATQKEAAERLGVSERSADRLARQAREAFVLPELEHHLPRRIEFMLAATPMSEARLAQVLRDVDPDDVGRALASLVEDGRVVATEERTVTYRPSATVRSLPRDTWTSRVGALASFGENLANAAWGRFFADDPAAFARTLSFRVTTDRAEQLAAWYADEVLPRIVAWDEEASDATDDDALPMQLSLCWAPYEAMTRQRVEPGEEA